MTTLVLMLVAFVVRPVECWRSFLHLLRRDHLQARCSFECRNFRYRITCDQCGKIFIDELSIGGPLR